MKEKPLISIIVPVYNVEKYLDRCIKSILQQTFKDFELILVDDGSTDGSEAICNQYRDIDNRIKVIHKENGGLSSARNAGLDIARGMYIGFVDSDDYINNKMYEILLDELIKNDSDLSICKLVRVRDDYKVDNKKVKIVEKNYNNLEALEELYRSNSVDFIVAWNKLYKSEILRDIRYPIGKKYEDEFVIHKILNKCKRVTYINQEMYYYYQRENSIINSKFSIKDIDKLYFNLDRMKFFKSINQNNLSEKCIYNFIINYFDIYHKIKYNLKDKSKCKELKKMLVANIYNISASYNFNIKEKLLMMMFLINDKFYYYRRKEGIYK